MRGSRSFEELTATRPHAAWADQLIREVAEGAEGSFLWASLVTRVLLRGIDDGDSFPELQAMLSEVLAIRNLYSWMLRRIENRHQQRAADYLLSARAFGGPFPLDIMAFIRNEHAELLKTPGPMETTELNHVREELTRRIMDCGSLLEVVNTPTDAAFPAKAQCVHWTLLDMLNTPDTLKTLEDWTQHGDIRRTLCEALAAMLSKLPLSENEQYVSALSWLTSNFLEFARQLELENTPLESRVLDSFDETARARQKMQDHYNQNHHWTTVLPHSDDLEDAGCKTFEALAVEAGLVSYLRKRLTPGIVRAKTGRPYLDYALLPKGRLSSNPATTLELVKVVLEAGGNPNDEWRHKTVWHRFLSNYYRDSMSGTSPTSQDATRLGDEWAPTISLLLEHGADTEQRIIISENGEDKTLGVDEVLGKVNMSIWSMRAGASSNPG